MTIYGWLEKATDTFNAEFGIDLIVDVDSSLQGDVYGVHLSREWYFSVSYEEIIHNSHQGLVNLLRTRLMQALSCMHDKVQNLTVGIGTGTMKYKEAISRVEDAMAVVNTQLGHELLSSCDVVVNQMSVIEIHSSIGYRVYVDFREVKCLEPAGLVAVLKSRIRTMLHVLEGHITTTMEKLG